MEPMCCEESNFKQRLLNEYDELTVKISNLCQFITNKNSITEEESHLLDSQLKIMEEYKNALKQRIKFYLR